MNLSRAIFLAAAMVLAVAAPVDSSRMPLRLRHLEPNDAAGDNPADEASDNPAALDDCDDLIGDSGLYGLCVAYCEATDCSDNSGDPGCQQIEDAFDALNGDEDQPSCFCFPKDALVQVEGQEGLTRMESVELGDRVRTATGYSEVYAFGLRTLDGDNNRFIKLTTESNESIMLTPTHMIFVGKEMKSLLAKDVKEGDHLTIMPQKELQTVRSVETVRSAGAIHPLTYEGSIVVNGVVASVHGVDSDIFAPVAKIGGFVLLDQHQFQQVFLSPLRMLCKIDADSFCSEKNHWNDGAHHLFDTIESMMVFLMPDAAGTKVGEEANYFTPTIFLPIKIAVFSWMVAVYAIESVISSSLAMVVLAAFAVLAFTGRFVTIKMSNKEKKVKTV